MMTFKEEILMYAEIWDLNYVCIITALLNFLMLLPFADIDFIVNPVLIILFPDLLYSGTKSKVLDVSEGKARPVS